MFTQKERIEEIVSYALKHGDDVAMDTYNLSHETLSRYKRRLKELGDDPKVPEVLKTIQERYSKKELEAIAKGAKISTNTLRIPNVNFDGDCITIGLFGDTHIGSIYFNEKVLDKAFAEFEHEGVDFLIHTGDVCDGLSNRAGHVYELSEIGFHSQREKAVELLSRWEGKIYFIDGNHDRWFAKANQALIVDDVAKLIPDGVFLGHDEGNLYMNGIKITVWHGEDGNSYATSYRLQKIAEAFTGGEKPNILFCGHTHKQGYFMERNIHIVSAGSIQTQSKWMRSKRLAAHVGFWIIKAWINKDGVSKFQPTWYPFYA